MENFRASKTNQVQNINIYNIFNKLETTRGRKGRVKYWISALGEIFRIINSMEKNKHKDFFKLRKMRNLVAKDMLI